MWFVLMFVNNENFIFKSEYEQKMRYISFIFVTSIFTHLEWTRFRAALEKPQNRQGASQHIALKYNIRYENQHSRGRWGVLADLCGVSNAVTGKRFVHVNVHIVLKNVSFSSRPYTLKVISWPRLACHVTRRLDYRWTNSVTERVPKEGKRSGGRQKIM